MANGKRFDIETVLAHSGSLSQDKQQGFVNPPAYRGSTVLYRNVREYYQSTDDELRLGERVYGRFGTPSTRAFESAMRELEGGWGAVAASSGMAAIVNSILAFVSQGAHILVPSSVYGGTRRFCNTHLAKMGVEVEYYDPLIGAAIDRLLQENTALVFLESPGSMTFEVQDVPAITKACREKKIATVMDNTWASPLFLKPLSLGVDVVVHSASKYICGHSDRLLGVAVCNEWSFPFVRKSFIQLGQSANSEDCLMGLRGLRTLQVRLAKHQEQAFELATWLMQHPRVDKVLYPALPQDAGHSLWRRDFCGASGLFSLVLSPDVTAEEADAMVDSCRLFGIGSGWGGFESLIIPAGRTSEGAFRLRIHVGLENLHDLKEDLKRAFQMKAS